MRRTLLTLAAAAMATACSNDDATAPTAPATTTTQVVVQVPLDTIPAASSTTTPTPPPEGTTRGSVVAMTGGDGPGDHHATTERYPPVPDELDLSPLPQAITDQQGQTDPAAVARQWAGVKVRTSGLLDGPLWPLSVGAHLRALSDPTGQWLPNSDLQAVDVVATEQLDTKTAAVTVRVEALDEAGALVTLTYDIELWLSDDGYWLVAFADVQT